MVTKTCTLLVFAPLIVLCGSKLAAVGNQHSRNQMEASRPSNPCKKKLERRQHFLLALLCSIALATVVHSQDQSGFISIDCGCLLDCADSKTGLKYVSDAEFIHAGLTSRISADFTSASSFSEPFLSLRAFPQGVRNCYKVDVSVSSRYLIRATFLYGNYDGQNNTPQFDIHLGPNKWATVGIKDAAGPIIKEIIHVPTVDYIHVCLVNTNTGIPFISVLELRVLDNSVYKTGENENEALVLYSRLDLGHPRTDEFVRYPADVYDRIWFPSDIYNTSTLSTSSTIENNDNEYKPPSIVLSTASTPIFDDDALELSIDLGDNILRFYYYMHFAEISVLGVNETRAFNIYFDGEKVYSNLVPDYLSSFTVYSVLETRGIGGRYNVSFQKIENSTLPPLLNAYELYSVLPLSEKQSKQEDIATILSIKRCYGIERNWQGDPCAPQVYLWEGLGCSYSNTPRIISLNLSLSGLTGEIAPCIAQLQSLQSLDLSYNNLTGSVPDFLSQLPSLKVLYLIGNNFTGAVPPRLIEKSKQKSLSLRIDENPSNNSSTNGNQKQCGSHPCKERKRTLIVPIVATASAVLIVVAAMTIILLCFRRTKQAAKPKREVDIKENKSKEPLVESKKRHFTYNEILVISNNFEKVLGKGAFGTVYEGYLDNNRVAIKMLSSPSVQGYKQFKAEVELLLRVHHGNLTNLVGYCNDDLNIGLIYEFMAEGNLAEHLSEKNKNILSWERRLQIVAEAAQGLEYLHHGCKPPIVHRDVKTTNILLNDKFEAKLSDFGLSRAFPLDASHILSTYVAGTPGYLDPEYNVTYKITEKSDIYSFGVVILEVITGRPALKTTNNERIHVSQWVSSMLENGDIERIIDPRLVGDFDSNSAWKAVEIAMACLSPTSVGRPAMRKVVSELKDCIATGLARGNKAFEVESKGYLEIFSDSLPVPR